MAGSAAPKITQESVTNLIWRATCARTIKRTCPVKPVDRKLTHPLTTDSSLSAPPILSSLLFFALFPGCTYGEVQPASAVEESSLDAGIDAPSPDAPTYSGGSCSDTRVIEHYPWDIQSGAFHSQFDLVLGLHASSLDTPHAMLSLEVIGTDVPIPSTQSLSPDSSYNTCQVCMLMREGCTDSECQTLYFAAGGSISIHSADRNEQAGRIAATGSELLFVEWDLDTNKPVPNASCVEIQDYAIDYSWGTGL